MSNPQPGCHKSVLLTEEETCAVHRVASRHGLKRACELLGVSLTVLLNAKDHGGVRRDSAAKIRMRLRELEEMTE